MPQELAFLQLINGGHPASPWSYSGGPGFKQQVQFSFFGQQGSPSSSSAVLPLSLPLSTSNLKSCSEGPVFIPGASLCVWGTTCPTPASGSRKFFPSPVKLHTIWGDKRLVSGSFLDAPPDGWLIRPTARPLCVTVWEEYTNPNRRAIHSHVTQDTSRRQKCLGQENANFLKVTFSQNSTSSLKGF